MENLLDEIKNKLNNLLDIDLDICQHYSSMVIVLYKKILSHLNGDMDINCFRDDINELICYISKENEAFNKLLSYDRTTLFPKINLHVDKEDGEPGYLRFINRLRFIKNVYNGFSINARDLHIDKINVDMKFDIYSAIFSVIYIEVFNEILGKFESLSIDGEQDEIFVSCLYGELNFKLIYRCSCNDLFEMICLHNDMNIDKFPDIKMDVLFKKLSAIYNEDVANHISEILYNSIIDDINKMVKKNKIDNNPEDVFDYFYFNIKVNVILSYLNKLYLNKLLDYCNNITFNNVYIKENIKRLIRNCFEK